jgi:hypothetical protein
LLIDLSFDLLELFPSIYGYYSTSPLLRDNPPLFSASARALFGAEKTAGALIAEGDSWFDYPMQDVLRLLEDDYLFDAESVAHKGDCKAKSIFYMHDNNQ